jgi:hypothetical protein
MAKDAIYSGKREVRTFVSLNRGADVLIQKAEEDEKGSNYTTMAALLLTAFTFEAYLNHLGEYHFKLWNKDEPIKMQEKCDTLCEKLGLVPDYSRLPYQTLKSLFKFRNTMAHGNSVILEIPPNKPKNVSSQDDPYEHTPKTDWEEYCTLKNAKRTKEDISEIITELHKKAGLGDYPFTYGFGTGHISIKPNNPDRTK